jgi:hypothetical protein
VSEVSPLVAISEFRTIPCFCKQKQAYQNIRQYQVKLCFVNNYKKEAVSPEVEGNSTGTGNSASLINILATHVDLWWLP